MQAEREPDHSPDASAASGRQVEAAMSEAERAATCALAGLGGIGGQSLGLLRQAWGSLAAAVARGGEELSKTPGLRVDGVESLRRAPDLERRGRWLLEQARALGATVLVAGDADYPATLSGASGAPPVLYVLGSLQPARRAAIVGSRRADDYGLERARAVAATVCQAGLEVVSGGAEGVDRAAHEQAIRMEGRTVAVVGSGLLNPYPAAHRSLYERIAQHGAVVSEFALDSGGQRTHFPQRNRTIAGLSDAVAFVRGDERSGALSTCETARRLGRPVFAVPGQVGDPLAAAPNAWLASERARVTLDGRELVRALLGHAPSGGPVSERPAIDAPAPLPENVTEAGRRVLAALGPAPRHVDELAAEAELGTAETLAELLSLELSGLCVARPGKYFLRR